MIDDVIAKLKATSANSSNKVLLSYTDELVILTVVTGKTSAFTIVVKDAVLLDGIQISSPSAEEMKQADG